MSFLHSDRRATPHILAEYLGDIFHGVVALGFFMSAEKKKKSGPPSWAARDRAAATRPSQTKPSGLANPKPAPWAKDALVAEIACVLAPHGYNKEETLGLVKGYNFDAGRLQAAVLNIFETKQRAEEQPDEWTQIHMFTYMLIKSCWDGERGGGR